MKIYCSGIGGAGLSAYAALQASAGHTVLGSDREPGPFTASLEEQGITISYTQDGSSVTEDIDLFVFSEAIPSDAPERVKAATLGILSRSYFAALGELSKQYNTIAVCGTHGKSTTTAMAAKVLIDAGLDPTVVVGTKVPQLNGQNVRVGQSSILLVEACEYRRSFHYLHPNSILMTNVDGDHFDAFDTIEDYQSAFSEFISRLPEDGVVITHMADEECASVTKHWKPHTGLIIDADQLPFPTLSVAGLHMQKNAQLVSALAHHLGIESAESLQGFSGTWRRFELKGSYSIPNTQHSIPIIDDYAHHPLEIRATIDSAQKTYPDSRIVIVFQPHLHDRTRRLYDEFCSSFTGADLLVLTDPYDARPDVETDVVDMQKFADDISIETIYGGSLQQAKELLCSTVLQQHDVLIVMGAGDVTTVAKQLTEDH